MTIEREKALLARKLVAQPFVETLTGNLAQMNVLDLAEYLLANFIFKAAAPDDLQKNLEAWWIECNGTGIDACSTCRPPQVCAWHLARLDDLKDLLANYTPKPAVPGDGELREQAFKKLDSKTFRYGSMPSVKHGLNISDAKHVVDWILNRSASQAAAAQERAENRLGVIRSVEKVNGLTALHEFASTLTTRARELEAKERKYEIVPGQATDILTSMIESFVYAFMKTAEMKRLAAQPKEQQPKGAGDMEKEA